MCGSRPTPKNPKPRVRATPRSLGQRNAVQDDTTEAATKKLTYVTSAASSLVLSTFYAAEAGGLARPLRATPFSATYGTSRWKIAVCWPYSRSVT